MLRGDQARIDREVAEYILTHPGERKRYLRIKNRYCYSKRAYMKGKNRYFTELFARISD